VALGLPLEQIIQLVLKFPNPGEDRPVSWGFFGIIPQPRPILRDPAAQIRRVRLGFA